MKIINGNIGSRHINRRMMESRITKRGNATRRFHESIVHEDELSKCQARNEWLDDILWKCLKKLRNRMPSDEFEDFVYNVCGMSREDIRYYLG